MDKQYFIHYVEHNKETSLEYKGHCVITLKNGIRHVADFEKLVKDVEKALEKNGKHQKGSADVVIANIIPLPIK